MNKLSNQVRIIVFFASLIMIPVFFVPIWEIAMWAPQYPEGLNMYLWIDNISGDVDIINGLNHYIGMKHIKVEMFPEFSYMKYILMFIVAYAVMTALVSNRMVLWSLLGLLLFAGALGMYDFYAWGLDYGSNLDPTAAIKVPGMVYQPPLLGTKELLNFTAYSGPATGGYLLGVSGLLVIISIILDWKRKGV